MFNNRLITFKYIFIFYAIVLREREKEREKLQDIIKWSRISKSLERN